MGCEIFKGPEEWLKLEKKKSIGSKLQNESCKMKIN